jgi:hypothetical protein
MLPSERHVQTSGELADGNAVQEVPVHATLTTQEAADLMTLENQSVRDSEEALAELAQQAQNLKMGYE